MSNQNLKIQYQLTIHPINLQIHLIEISRYPIRFPKC